MKAVMITLNVKGADKKAQRFYERVLKPEQKIVVPNVWRKGEGEVFYYKKLSNKGDA